MKLRDIRSKIRNEALTMASCVVLGAAAALVGLLLGGLVVGPLLRVAWMPVDFNTDYSSPEMVGQAALSLVIGLTTAFGLVGMIVQRIRPDFVAWPWLSLFGNPVSTLAAFAVFRQLVDARITYEYVSLAMAAILALASVLLLVPSALLGAALMRGRGRRAPVALQ